MGTPCGRAWHRPGRLCGRPRKRRASARSPGGLAQRSLPVSQARRQHGLPFRDSSPDCPAPAPRPRTEYGAERRGVKKEVAR